LAGKLSSGNFGLSQQYRHETDVPCVPTNVFSWGKSGHTGDITANLDDPDRVHRQTVVACVREANIKHESLLSDVMGRSGRAIIQALIDGETDPAKLAALAHWKVRASTETLSEALRGRIKRNHRFLLRLHLQQDPGA
jgi:hypothetical protein